MLIIVFIALVRPRLRGAGLGEPTEQTQAEDLTNLAWIKASPVHLIMLLVF
jgi:hypothetical protein